MLPACIFDATGFHELRQNADGLMGRNRLPLWMHKTLDVVHYTGTGGLPGTQACL